MTCLRVQCEMLTDEIGPINVAMIPGAIGLDVAKDMQRMVNVKCRCHCFTNSGRYQKDQADLPGPGLHLRPKLDASAQLLSAHALNPKLSAMPQIATRDQH